jgi:hypothetical protein
MSTRTAVGGTAPARQRGDVLRPSPIPNDRDLREELGGVIFGATAETMQGA